MGGLAAAVAFCVATSRWMSRWFSCSSARRLPLSTGPPITALGCLFRGPPKQQMHFKSALGKLCTLARGCSVKYEAGEAQTSCKVTSVKCLLLWCLLRGTLENSLCVLHWSNLDILLTCAAGVQLHRRNHKHGPLSDTGNINADIIGTKNNAFNDDLHWGKGT